MYTESYEVGAIILNLYKPDIWMVEVGSFRYDSHSWEATLKTNKLAATTTSSACSF